MLRMTHPVRPEPAEAGRGTREGILEAARRRFLRFGPRKTTMDEGSSF